MTAPATAFEIELIRCDAAQVFKAQFRFQSAPQVSQVLACCDWADVQLGPGGAQSWAVSVWGRSVALDSLLKSGDRVELTRGLLVDPKRARAHKVAQTPRRGWVKRMAKC
jgi:putative ubiquitin-RnfH superfamily antitoxin RatB of RatAB toxin-antitoxin module